MPARLPKVLIALALAGSIGLHWTVLQAVAWAGMIVGYAQEAPLTEAVLKTFDGQHPCKLCKQIAKGKQSEKKAEYRFELSRLEFFYTPFGFVFGAPTFFHEAGIRNSPAHLLTYSPPTPPPRAYLG